MSLVITRKLDNLLTRQDICCLAWIKRRKAFVSTKLTKAAAAEGYGQNAGSVFGSSRQSRAKGQKGGNEVTHKSFFLVFLNFGISLKISAPTNVLITYFLFSSIKLMMLWENWPLLIAVLSQKRRRDSQFLAFSGSMYSSLSFKYRLVNLAKQFLFWRWKHFKLRF